MDAKLKNCPKCNAEVKMSFCEPECCGGLPRYVLCECGLEFWFPNFTSYDECVKMWNFRCDEADKKVE